MHGSATTDQRDEAIFLADGNAEFAKAIGMELDASRNGLGIRSKRYSMLVDDGVVKKFNLEPAPGKVEVLRRATRYWDSCKAPLHRTQLSSPGIAVQRTASLPLAYDRAIQYTAASRSISLALEYWITRLRG